MTVFELADAAAVDYCLARGARFPSQVCSLQRGAPLRRRRVRIVPRQVALKGLVNPGASTRRIKCLCRVHRQLQEYERKLIRHLESSYWSIAQRLYAALSRERLWSRARRSCALFLSPTDLPPMAPPETVADVQLVLQRDTKRLRPRQLIGAVSGERIFHAGSRCWSEARKVKKFSHVIHPQ